MATKIYQKTGIEFRSSDPRYREAYESLRAPIIAARKAAAYAALTVEERTVLVERSRERLARLDDKERRRRLGEAARARTESRKRWNLEAGWGCKLRHRAKIGARHRGLEWSPELTAEWIYSRWQEQRGRCFYTGIKMRHEAPDGAGADSMRRPSLDRVDASKGYVPGNVVLCLAAMNYAKHDYSETDFMALLDEIRTHRPESR